MGNEGYQSGGTWNGGNPWSWSAVGGDLPDAPDGNGVVFVGGGETGAKHAVAADSLHRLNRLSRQASPSAFVYGEVSHDPARGIVRLGNVEGWLLFDGDTGWLRSRESEALNLAAITYSFHDHPGIAADTEEARRLFVRAQQGNGVGFQDPYKRRAPSVEHTRPSEWIRERGATEAGVVILLASAGSGSGQGAIQGILESEEIFG